MTTSADLTHRMIVWTGIASLLVPGAATLGSQPEPPQTVQITGIVRDFKAVDEPTLIAAAEAAGYERHRDQEIWVFELQLQAETEK